MADVTPARYMVQMAASTEKVTINKASIANAAAGQFHSLWRATGIPAQGAIPGAAAIPTKATTGALLNFANPAGGNKKFIGKVGWRNLTNSGGTLIWADRIGHMGGLNGTLTTAQNVNLSALSLAGTRCRSDYLDVQWFLEWYTDTGATGVNATINFTRDNGAAGTPIVIALGATRRASFMQPIVAASGEIIREVTTVTLSATTGAAGSFGVTALVDLTPGLPFSLVNTADAWEFFRLGCPDLHQDACIMAYMNAVATTTGNVLGDVKLFEA